jgi:hypothetical protein
MPKVDLFRIWRLLLVLIGGVYTLVLLVQAIRNLNRLLDPRDRYRSIARKYLVVKLLGLRWRRFAGEVALIVFLGVALIALLYVHHVLRLL